MNNDVLIVIMASACITYMLRLGGLLLAGRLPKTGRFKLFMDALPGTILLSLILPAALNGGVLTIVATVCVAFCSVRYGNVFLAMVIGVALVAVGRYIGL